jgi:DNA polymerase-3 subunit gamma/tau
MMRASEGNSAASSFESPRVALETAVAVADYPEVALAEVLAIQPTETIDEPASIDEPAPVLANAASSGPAAGTQPDLNTLRDAVVNALDQKGHHTAAALLSEGKWTLNGDVVEAEIGVKKMMLGLVMNADAEKTARATLRELGVQRKFVAIAGEASPGGNAARPVSQGSIQAHALENPLVKQAQELFRAEVRSVLDLRDKT